MTYHLGETMVSEIPATLTTVTGGGRYGIAKLTRPIGANQTYALINRETAGRNDLMQRLGGKLRVGAEVVITEYDASGAGIVAHRIREK